MLHQISFVLMLIFVFRIVIIHGNYDPNKEWDKFQAFDKGDSDNKIWYSIRNIPENRFEEAMKLMEEHYLQDEPMNVALGRYNDQDIVELHRDGWSFSLEQNVSVACYRNGTNEMVGIIISSISEKEEKKEDDDDDDDEDDNNDCIIDDVNLFEEYKVKRYLEVDHFAVSRDYRGRGRHIGQRLLEVNKLICAHNNLDVAAGIFTSPASRKIAKNLGYDEKYSRSKEYNGKIVEISVMARKFT